MRNGWYLQQVTPDPIRFDQPNKSLRTESVGIQCLFLILNLNSNNLSVFLNNCILNKC